MAIVLESDQAKHAWKLIKLTSPIEGEKGMFLVARDGSRQKIHTLSGDIMDIVLSSYAYDNETKYQYMVEITDINEESGEIDTYKLQMSEDGMHTHSFLNTFLSLPTHMGISISAWVKNTDTKDYLQTSLKCGGEKVGWKYQQNEIPAPKEIKVGGKTFKDNTDKINFFRTQVSAKYQQLFGKPWAWTELLGGGTIPTATVSPATPTANPPATYKASAKIVQADLPHPADAKFEELLNKISACASKEELANKLSQGHSWAVKQYGALSPQKTAALDKVVRQAATILGLVVRSIVGSIVDFDDDLPF